MEFRETCHDDSSDRGLQYRLEGLHRLSIHYFEVRWLLAGDSVEISLRNALYSKRCIAMMGHAIEMKYPAFCRVQSDASLGEISSTVNM
jgi:hypothetical protein